MSDIQDYIKYIIKKQETLLIIPPIHFYINRINTRLVLKMKDQHKLQVKTLETIKLFGSRKTLTGKTKKMGKTFQVLSSNLNI